MNILKSYSNSRLHVKTVNTNCFIKTEMKYSKKATAIKDVIYTLSTSLGIQLLENRVSLHSLPLSWESGCMFYLCCLGKPRNHWFIKQQFGGPSFELTTSLCFLYWPFQVGTGPPFQWIHIKCGMGHELLCKKREHGGVVTLTSIHVLNSMCWPGTTAGCSGQLILNFRPNK